MDVDEVITRVLHEYPQIKLSNILVDPVYKDGLTISQINILYEKALLRSHENYRILGGFNGIKIPSSSEVAKKHNLKTVSDEDKKAASDLTAVKLTSMFGKIDTIKKVD